MSDAVEKLQPTRDTEYCIKQWAGTIQHVESLKGQLALAERDAQSATNELGRFLSPSDAKIGETFNIWYGDGLLQITKTNDLGNNDTFVVSWRKRPREMPHC